MITPYNASLELRRIAAEIRPASLRHFADPSHKHGTDRRILCQDGHWHRITELQRDLRCESDALIHATE